MLELNTVKKQKINLNDYPYLEDVRSRSLLADFSVFDLEVLEEILFSSLKTSVKKVSRSLGCTEGDLDPILSKLEGCALLERQGDLLFIDKDKRKYFEFQISRFEEDFKPDMEFLQGLLKQIPIHLLPAWYATPRSSNNIFESIIEKYLLTPQIYQRYLLDLNFADPVLSGILQDLFASSELKLSSSDLISKYNLARADFDRLMLQLELHFVCFVSYQREEDHWHEIVTPFHEWREYMLFLQATDAPAIEQTDTLFTYRNAPFAFIQDMETILTLAQKKSLPLNKIRSLAHQIGLETDTPEELRFAETYLARIIEKLVSIRLADKNDGSLYALESVHEWLSLDLEARAVQLHRSLPSPLSSEGNVREAEKSIKRVLKKGWVYFDDFIRGVMVPLHEGSAVALKKNGKHWKYTIPQYSEEERAFIQTVVFDWLFECGIVATGSIDGKDCFTATPFGRIFFQD